MSVTKHQSGSYANPSAGYKALFFGWNRSSRNELLVGVSFHPKDCLFWMMMLYDSGTYYRPKDFDTREAAQAYLDQQESSAVYCKTLAELEKSGKNNLDKFNEVLAGLKWNLDGSSHITVFSDNLESRLLAQLRALDLQKRLEEKYPDKKPITVPISIYPDINDPKSIDFKLYTTDMQKRDISDAKDNLEVSHYIEAIHFINTGTTIPSIPPVRMLEIYILLEKLGKKYAEDYFSKINNDNLYFLISMLNYAVARNSPAIIEKIIAFIFQSLENNDHAKIVNELSEKATAGDFAGRNGFFMLMSAITKIKTKKDTLFPLLFTVLIKLNNQQLPKEFKDKSELREHLKQYILSNTDAVTLKKVFAPGTMLSALIDHDVNPIHGFFRKKGTKTATRKLLEEQFEKIRNSASSPGTSVR